MYTSVKFVESSGPHFHISNKAIQEFEQFHVVILVNDVYKYGL